MDSLTKSLDDILQEHSLIELDLEIKIKEILDKIQSDFEKVNKYDENLNANVEWQKQNDEARKRNKNLIMDLEQIKAKLRSLYCYQPASDNLDFQMKKYKNYIKRKYTTNRYQ